MLPPYDPAAPSSAGRSRPRRDPPAAGADLGAPPAVGSGDLGADADHPETDARFWKAVGLRNCFEGEWTEQISAGLEPLPEETFVYKTRHSGFFQTELEDVLRARGIETVIVAGRATSGCVEATCREGMARDFGIVLAADCCGPPGPTHDADVRRSTASSASPPRAPRSSISSPKGPKRPRLLGTRLGTVPVLDLFGHCPGTVPVRVFSGDCLGTVPRRD